MKLKHVFVLTIFLLSNLALWAGGLDTPRKCMFNFHHYITAPNVDYEKAAASLYRTGYSQQEAIQHVLLLKEILEGSGTTIDLNDFPDNTHFIDSTSGESMVVISHQFPHLYLAQYKHKQWMLSKESVDELKAIHKSIYPFGSDIVFKHLPGLGKNKVYGLYPWQFVGILCFLLVAFILHYGLRFVIGRIIGSLFIRFGHTQLVKRHIIPLANPIAISFIFWLLSIFIPMIQLPGKIGVYAITGLRSALPVFYTIVLYRLVDILASYMEKRAERTESTLDDQLVPLVRKALKTFVVVIGSLYVLQNLNVNITTLLAGLSIGGLAFALAAQDTIKNFFGSLMIFLDKPFQIGDWVVGNGLDGTIEEVGFRATRIRTFHNSLTYIPNGNIADMTIDNMGRRNFRRYKTTLGLMYDTPPSKMEEFIIGLRKLVDEHPDTLKENYHIYFHGYGNFSLDILFYIFFEVPNWAEELRARHEMNLKIHQLASDIGVHFAFPTQTLHVETFPGKESLSPTYNTTS